MRIALLVGLVAAGACASSGTQSGSIGDPGGGDAGSNRQSIVLTGGQAFPGSANIVGTPDASTATWHPMNASAQRTWEYLPIAYSKLGLSITRYDSTSHIIEGERLRSRADFGGKQLTAIFNCGDVAGIPNVTRFDVNILVRSAVRGTASTSSVASVVTATAKPDATSGDVSPCTVNQVAADRIAATVAEALAATK